MRYDLRLFVLALMWACVASPSHKVVRLTTLMIIEDSTLHARVLSRDVAWIADTIPIVRYETPFSYGALRVEVERCSQLRVYGEWPTFYVAPVNPLPAGWLAFYDPDLNVIVFALGMESNPYIVRHELLHWLLHPITPSKPRNETIVEKDLRQHPPAYFGGYVDGKHVRGKCSGLVTET